MVRIYTKGGDRGTTSLFGGRRVDKNSLRIRAYGEVDELNSLIGVIISELLHYSSSESDEHRTSREVMSSWSEAIGSKVSSRQARTIKDKLLRIQTELFVLGADLATPYEVSTTLALRGAGKTPRVTKSFITRLEKEIDKWSKSLPQLKNFILPGGGKAGSKLHCARTVARRAERSIVDLSTGEKVNKTALIYINRLSDWLFVLARYINQLQSVKEVPWKGRAKI